MATSKVASDLDNRAAPSTCVMSNFSDKVKGYSGGFVTTVSKPRIFSKSILKRIFIPRFFSLF